VSLVVTSCAIKLLDMRLRIMASMQSNFMFSKFSGFN
jgi:hypothetical protein